MSDVGQERARADRRRQAMPADAAGLGYRLEAPTADDLAAIAALIRECETADTGEAQSTHDHVVAETHAEGFELSRDAWLILDRKGAPAGFAWLFETLPGAEMEGELCVHPAHRGRGLEDVLLRLLETGALERLPPEPSAVVISLGVSCLQDDRARRRLFEDAGFVKVREFRHMEIDLRGPAGPRRHQLPDGLSLRGFGGSEDARPVYDALSESFAEEFRYGQETYETWSGFCFDRESVDTDLWVVAARGDEVVGAVISFAEKGVGFISDFGVRATWRRRGIGTALLEEAFDRLRAHGCSRAWLNVDAQNPTGAVAVYEAAGMRPVRRFDFFEKRYDHSREDGGGVAGSTRRGR
jgi:mycothiol synthase